MTPTLDYLARKVLQLRFFGISFQDLNADYLDTRTNRRRTAAYIGLIILALALVIAASSLVPGLDRLMGWEK